MLRCIYRNYSSNVELVYVFFIERFIVIINLHIDIELDFLYGVYIKIIICLNNYIVWCQFDKASVIIILGRCH